MFVHIIYSSLWYIIHFILTLYTSIYKGYYGLKTTLYRMKSEYKQSAYLFSNAQTKVCRLKKIPKHITVLLGEEDPSFKDLANFILFSVASGVSFLSFYDVQGDIKRNECVLQKEVERNLPWDHHVVWYNKGKNGYKNGFSGRKINVKILVPNDGRDSVTDVCKDLIGEGDIDINLVDACMRKHYEFPDPELAVYTGGYLNLRGYPPWHIRLTEFLNLNTLQNITFLQFYQVLHRYNQCEQRVGK